jgi:hypothetical protein
MTPQTTRTMEATSSPETVESQWFTDELDKYDHEEETRKKSYDAESQELIQAAKINIGGRDPESNPRYQEWYDQVMVPRGRETARRQVRWERERAV